MFTLSTDRQLERNKVDAGLYPEEHRKYQANLLNTGNIRYPHYVVISNMSRLEQTLIDIIQAM